MVVLALITLLAVVGVEARSILPERVKDLVVQGDSLSILFVANEGVLIELGERRVLIDGLHRPYQPIYGTLPEGVAADFEAAAPPFGGIDLILVSHRHRDHFHPEAVARYLRASGGTRLVSSPQVVRETLVEGADLTGRVAEVLPGRGESVSRSFGDLRVEFLGLPHGGGRHREIQNLGHLVELGGRRILHLGDAHLDADAFEMLDLASRGVDVAFIPYWYLLEDEGRALVDRLIDPGRIVAVHVPPDEVDAVRDRVSRVYPDAVVFGRPLVSAVRIARAV